MQKLQRPAGPLTAGPCPWCLKLVGQVDAAELREIVSRHRQLTLPLLEHLADDWPCWWCPTCHHGGMLVRSPG